MSQDIVTFGVIGLGYVGLPLSVEAGRSGLKVIGFDINTAVVTGVNAGRSHIQDLTDADVASLLDQGLLEATTDMRRLAECDAVSICVPTPLSKTRDPDVSYVIAASEAVAAALRPGQLIVLESTTYPGTTREVMQPALERTGLVVGEDFHLCFSPERVDPGNETWTTKNTPKVIGGLTEACSDAGTAFYERFIDRVVRVSSAEAAELTKILENTFRAVNIGLVNEVALIADLLGVDVWEVIDAAATKPFGFMKFTPGPGLGGHCIPVDPHYLAWKMRTLNYKTRFIDLASEINAEMPIFVADKVREVLNRKRLAVNGSKIVLLGVAYKRDIDDVRESPALDVLKLLEADGADVAYHDPFVPEWKEDGVTRRSQTLTDELLSGADAVVILTDHTDFDYAWILEKAKALVDARHAVVAAGAVPAGGAGSWIVKG
ncbi:MAG: nucleotide sugar dehydrogenase [Gemmatimonadota bacterium]|nr:nucleotide sugar dehydrogenase [Gemmatimonadota bacterium]HIC54968.1 nucleotide sugar dehydrogenase [Gemmatimonadota bacterium]